MHKANQYDIDTGNSLKMVVETDDSGTIETTGKVLGYVDEIDAYDVQFGENEVRFSFTMIGEDIAELRNKAGTRQIGLVTDLEVM